MNFWKLPVLNSKTEKEKIGVCEKIFGYFLGPFLVLAMTSIISSYYLTFYRSYDDIVAKGGFLTVLPLISVLPMALANILIGILVGKTKTAQGKARPYILAAAPILLFSGILIFWIPDLGLKFRMGWMVITYNLFAALANPMYGTSHYLMVSLSTRDLKQRGQLSVIANIPAVAANGFISSILMPVALNWIHGAKSQGGIQQRWQILMNILAVAAFLGCLLEYWFTRERITEEDIEEQKKVQENRIPSPKISTFTKLKNVTSDKFWWIIMIFYALYQAGVMFKGGYIFNIYCHEFFVDTTIFGIQFQADMIQSVLALISGIPLAAGMLFIWPLANKFGKRNMVIVGCILSVIGSIICLIAPSNFLIVLIGQTVKGFSSIPGCYIMMALFADVLDHLEARFGYRVDGISMSIYNTILTVVNGLAVAFFNFFYDGSVFAASDVAKFFFLGYEVIAHGILIFLLLFLSVEKTIEEEQKIIADRKISEV